MGLGIGFLCSSYVILLALSISLARADPLVPSLCIFGDSVVDAGNNNNPYTLAMANFPPYGRDFADRSPTGRFCNGKLATYFTKYPEAEMHILYLQLTSLIGRKESLPPTWYLPAAITLFGAGSNECVQRLNQDAVSFNIRQ